VSGPKQEVLLANNTVYEFGFIAMNSGQRDVHDQQNVNYVEKAKENRIQHGKDKLFQWQH